MRRQLFIVALLFLCVTAPSQTISWLDFNKDVFTKASEQKKLVILDLGASWCHWCHVMDDSTYSNKAVIDYLSSNYICARANQDFRPDLYSRYKEYGWPATVIFDAEANELVKYAGYANPREFLNLLAQTVENPGMAPQPAAKVLSEGRWNDSIRRYIQNDFDNFLDYEKGAFDMNQKFVEYDAFEYVLLHQEDPVFKNWLKVTVRNSEKINDRVWGGVYQYSTGRDWNYPHFEKILSVQARYLKIYSRYYAVLKDQPALAAAKNIVRYLDRFLKSSTALYYNSQDADLKEGEHAGDYFIMNDKLRLARGIPRIDSTCCLKENALLAEAFVYLWSATGDTLYLNRAGRMLHQLDRDFYVKGFGYVHYQNERNAIALGDYEYFCRALISYYNATGSEWSKEKAGDLGREIIRNFKGTQGFVNYRSGTNPLPPTPMLTENIDLCRLLNRLYYVTGDEQFRTAAKQIFSYLISEKVLKEIIAESGILMAKEELDREPVKLVVFLRSEHESEWNQALTELWRLSSDYFVIDRVIGEAVPEKYMDMRKAAGESNCAFMCSSTSCSSPVFKTAELKKVLAGRGR